MTNRTTRSNSTRSNLAKKHLVEHWESAGIIRDKRLLKAFMEMPREEFVLDELKDEAYTDMPLPLFDDQTISQPTTIMIMLDALELKKDDVVLEIGTGSGYNAALIARLAKKVYTTEIIPKLAEFAGRNISRIGIKNIEIIETDGSNGYLPCAPYDKIIATAACPEIPPPLAEQLKEGGIIVAPVGCGSYGFCQSMIKARKIKGSLEKENLGSFMFVPLRGRHGFE